MTGSRVSSDDDSGSLQAKAGNKSDEYPVVSDAGNTYQTGFLLGAEWDLCKTRYRPLRDSPKMTPLASIF